MLDIIDDAIMIP